MDLEVSFLVGGKTNFVGSMRCFEVRGTVAGKIFVFSFCFRWIMSLILWGGLIVGDKIDVKGECK